MSFTNVWDTTFPADTQLANLLGSDLRQLRVDVQQRMAAISGLDASKPTFTSDAQPNNWSGILFFALDTGKVYQLSAGSWLDASADILSSTPGCYVANGGPVTEPHTVIGTVTVSSNGGSIAQNLLGAAAFTNSTSYFVTLGHPSAGGVASVVKNSGSQFTVTASLLGIINFIAIGT